MKKVLFVLGLLVLSFLLISCNPETQDKIVENFLVKDIPDQQTLTNYEFVLNLKDFVVYDEDFPVTVSKKSGEGTLDGYLFKLTPSESKTYEVVLTFNSVAGTKDVKFNVKSYTKNTEIMINAVEFVSGSFNENVKFSIFNEKEYLLPSMQSVVEENGVKYYKVLTSINESTEYVNILAKKINHGLSRVQGLKVEKDSVSKVDMVVMKSSINSNPDNTKLADFKVIMFDENGKETLNINNGADVNVYYDHYKKGALKQFIIYSPLLDRIPGSGSMVSDRSSTYEDKKIFNLNTKPYEDGEHVLYTVAYDHNNNRIMDIKYVNVTNNKEALTKDFIYRPMNMTTINATTVERQLYDVYSYTRRMGLEFYSDDNSIYSEADMKGTNLYNVLYWLDYDSIVKLGANMVDTQKPLGYNIYRSFDNGEEKTYEKIGYVSSDFVSGLAYDYYMYRLSLQLDYAKYYYKPMFVDSSSELQPGKTAYYSVSAVYNATEGYESVPTYLGSVTPLEQFNVELMTPADSSVDVDRNTAFIWDTTNDLSSVDGTVEYIYNMFIYDKTQASNGLITPLESPTSSDPAYGFDLYNIPNINGLATINFTGNVADVGTGVKWYNLDEYSLNITEYAYDKLQANKTYAWGVNVAYAKVEKDETVVEDQKSSTRQTIALSIANDYRLRDTSWSLDPFQSSEPDLHADFTTGSSDEQ